MANADIDMAKVRRDLQLICTAIGPGEAYGDLSEVPEAQCALPFCINDLIAIVPVSWVCDRFRFFHYPETVWLRLPGFCDDYPKSGVPVALTFLMAVLPRSIWTAEAFDHLSEDVHIPHSLLASALWGRRGEGR